MRIIIENYENIFIVYNTFLIFYCSPKIANKVIYICIHAMIDCTIKKTTPTGSSSS